MANDPKANPLARHGGLSYLEVPAAEPERSAEFYARVAGWKIDRRAEMDYRFSDGAGLLLGRFVIDRPPAREPGLTPVFYVDALDAALDAARAHGGEVAEPARREGDVRMARVRDPAGNLIGLWQFG